VQFSAPGDPLDFSGVNGAGETGVASPVTGMYPLNGQTLALFTRDNVQMMQGDVGAPTMGFASPNTGCIEYSAVSSGAYLYTSNRGVESMEQTASYGDFATQPLSAPVSPWLSRRVQRSVSYEGEDRSLVAALPVRAKQQLRLLFADRRQLTATFLRPGEPPQFTIQEFPDAFDVVLAATESAGRDRLFGACGDGYVFEFDRGNRFDDAAIAWSVTLTTDDQKLAFVTKSFTDAHVHGSVVGYGAFGMSTATNYDAPNPAVSYPQTFGDASLAAAVDPSSAVSLTEVRNHGRSLTLMFTGTDTSQPPVTLQAVSFNAVQTGETRT
jgi:hypothetical protein